MDGQGGRAVLPGQRPLAGRTGPDPELCGSGRPLLYLRPLDLSLRLAGSCPFKRRSREGIPCPENPGGTRIIPPGPSGKNAGSLPRRSASHAGNDRRQSPSGKTPDIFRPLSRDRLSLFAAQSGRYRRIPRLRTAQLSQRRERFRNPQTLSREKRIGLFCFFRGKQTFSGPEDTAERRCPF